MTRGYSYNQYIRLWIVNQQGDSDMQKGAHD